MLLQLSERLLQFAEQLLVLARRRLASDALPLRSDEPDFSNRRPPRVEQTPLRLEPASTFVEPERRLEGNQAAGGWISLPLPLKALRRRAALPRLLFPPMLLQVLVAATTATALAACDGCSRVSEPAPPPSTRAPASAKVAPATMIPAILEQRPHDPYAFTQGLLFADGAFLESTGRYGESSLRRVDPATGRVLKAISLPPNVFGEGLARLGGELFQLTWREHRCFVYDDVTFQKRRELTYEGEGWGLTSDGEALLVLSDGSATLRFVDPTSFRVVRTLAVHEGDRSLERLNELEWVRGEILANVWQASVILRIDPSSGEVRGHLDLSGLPEPPHHDDPDAVLNGIAYDAAGDRLFVTGKRWSTMFEIARPAR